MTRAKRVSSDAKDDDGKLLRDERNGLEALAVAHILPHCLTSLGNDLQLICLTRCDCSSSLLINPSE